MLTEKVFLCGSTRVPPAKKIRKGSQGAERWVPWEYHEHVDELLVSLKHQNISIVALELSDQSVAYYHAEYSALAYSILGGEQYGVSAPSNLAKMTTI